MNRFKQLLSLFCALTLLFGVCAMPAAIAEEDNISQLGDSGTGSTSLFRYKYSDNYATITKYIGSKTTVTVPQKINGYKVTAIGASAFKGTKVKTVTISSGVESIAKYAFANTTLTKITLPKTITSIASTAFKGATVKTFKATSGTYAYEWGVKKGFIDSPTSKVTYRALLIGEYSFVNYDSYYGYYWDKTQRNVEDMNNMATMLSKVYGPTGSKYKVTKKKDASYAKIKSLIQSTFKSTKSTDVSLFFIATHGNSDGDGELAMPFLGSTVGEYQEFYYSDTSFLPFATLASWLQSYVKGKVIVIIESCGSGSAIYKASEENGMQLEGISFEEAMETLNDQENDGGLVANAPGPEEKVFDPNALIGTLPEGALAANGDSEPVDNFDPEAFVNSAISAFRSADPGIESEAVEFDEELTENSTGDLRVKNKFYVLAASRHHEMSWGQESGSSSYNYFTQWLIEGVGSKGNSPADTNGNNVLTLNELFKYLKKYNTYAFRTSDGTYYQHAQVFPVNSSYKVFRHK